METNILQIDALTVAFDGFKALNDLSLTIAKNELRVIIGPNGAGKTTFLDVLCGKTRPSSGHVRFRNHDLVRLAEHQIVRAGVARKFQTPSTYEDLTVLENFEISIPKGRGVFGSLFFRRDSEVMDRVLAIATQVFLDKSLDTKAGQLSHGQKQWLEIGMLLIQDPELLLLDEPVAGMSPREREQTAQLLMAIAPGKSIVLIEHDMEFVRSIARTVTVMHQGSVLCSGSLADVQNNARVIEVYLGA
ncbi:MAG: urea ABC transporter ATP-binding protein UrtD [Burkholderiaceae bacterium]|nr:urea ABC transporter ATP-binding protein UrtD [Burkholderiaceae bacterium]